MLSGTLTDAIHIWIAVRVTLYLFRPEDHSWPPPVGPELDPDHLFIEWEAARLAVVAVVAVLDVLPGLEGEAVQVEGGRAALAADQRAAGTAHETPVHVDVRRPAPALEHKSKHRYLIYLIQSIREINVVLPSAT